MCYNKKDSSPNQCSESKYDNGFIHTGGRSDKILHTFGHWLKKSLRVFRFKSAQVDIAEISRKRTTNYEGVELYVFSHSSDRKISVKLSKTDI